MNRSTLVCHFCGGEHLAFSNDVTGSNTYVSEYSASTTVYTQKRLNCVECGHSWKTGDPAQGKPTGVTGGVVLGALCLAGAAAFCACFARVTDGSDSAASIVRGGAYLLSAAFAISIPCLFVSVKREVQHWMDNAWIEQDDEPVPVAPIRAVAAPQLKDGPLPKPHDWNASEGPLKFPRRK